MTRQSLLKQKLILESLIMANLKEIQFIQASEDVNWGLLDSYYQSGRAFAAEHIEVMNQLGRR